MKMIQSNGSWVVEEDECIYGEYGEIIDKKLIMETVDFPAVA